MGGALVGSVLIVGATAGAAVAFRGSGAQAAAATGAHSHWNVRVIARNPVVRIDGRRVKLTSPDDVTELGGRLFVTWQNGVGPQGHPANNGTGIDFSIITEYTPSGHLTATWKLRGKCDGLTADPHNGTVIATIDEDARSSVDTIAPAAARNHQVVYYRYSPANPLPHGGGTDAISIDHNRILISASAPGTQGVTATGPAEMPAVYVTRFTRTPGTDRGVAHLRSLFTDGATAKVVNTAEPTPSAVSPSPPSYCPPAPAVCTFPTPGTPVSLKLTDPDSNEVVPASSRRFAGNFVLDSQGDQQQIYVSGMGTRHQRLSVLYLSQSIDDTAYITSSRGTLYATDQTTNEIVAITGPFRRGEAIVSSTPSGADNVVNAPNYLATLSLSTGTVTRIPGVAKLQSAGLLFVPPA